MPVIRSMTPVDLNQVCVIENAIHRMPWHYDIFHHCLWLNYRCRVLVLPQMPNDTIIGYCISRVIENQCHILNLGIERSHQRMGYAHQLLDEIISVMERDHSIHKFILEVRPSNLAAINLYEQYGFQKTGVKAGYYMDATSAEDALVLTRLITRPSS